MSNIKERALAIYNSHLELIATSGTVFRKTVINQIMSEFNVSLASASTHYNNCKKASAPIEGLGRAPVSKNVRRPGSNRKQQEELQDDNECFTVIELLKHNDGITVGRCRSHLMQGDASEDFDERIQYKPRNVWIMIQGLGPNHGDNFKLSAGEREIKRYTPDVVAVVEHEEPILED